jgi:hypothetical protein
MINISGFSFFVPNISQFATLILMICNFYMLHKFSLNSPNKNFYHLLLLFIFGQLVFVYFYDIFFGLRINSISELLFELKSIEKKNTYGSLIYNLLTLFIIITLNKRLVNKSN